MGDSPFCLASSPWATNQVRAHAYLTNLARTWAQLVIHGNADLARIGESKKGLIREVWRNEAKVKSILVVARIEEIADPRAHGPGAMLVADTHVLQVIGARGLCIAAQGACVKFR